MASLEARIKTQLDDMKQTEKEIARLELELAKGNTKGSKPTPLAKPKSGAKKIAAPKSGGGYGYGGGYDDGGYYDDIDHQSGYDAEDADDYHKGDAVVRSKMNVYVAEDFINDIIAQGQPWTDPEFPPCPESIRKDGDDASQMEDPECWARPGEIYDEFDVFMDDATMGDVFQGSLGNCYFMASLSSLAEEPQRIQARFINKEKNDAGIYGMSFFINNREEAVIVDDQFPAHTYNGKLEPKYASNPVCLPIPRDTTKGELWVMLLEKAWAKLHGSYARIEGGWSTHVTQHLTGFPSEHIMHEQVQIDDMWTKLSRYDKLGYIMNTTTIQDKEKRPIFEGLYSSHQYTLTGVAEFEHEGEQVRLIKLRNPHACNEWTGDWSDQSDKWTDELRERLGVQEQDDGVFWMSLEDFMQRFIQSSVCMAPKVPVERFDDFIEDRNMALYKLSIGEDIIPGQSIFHIMANQLGDRLLYYRDANNQFKPSQISITLFNAETKQKVPLEVSADWENFIQHARVPIYESLPAGDYMLWVQCAYNTEAYMGDEGYQQMQVSIISQIDVAPIKYNIDDAYLELVEVEGFSGDYVKQTWEAYNSNGRMQKEDFERWAQENYPSEDAEAWFTAADAMRRGELEAIDFLAWFVSVFCQG